ncbi:MAG: helix-turn-helix domain-containing protein [Planctomycetota bacterium]
MSQTPLPPAAAAEALDVPIVDPGAFCGGEHPFEGEMTQLERGPRTGRAIGLRTPTTQVWIYALERPVHARSALLPDRHVRTVPLSDAPDSLHNGGRLGTGDVLEFAPGYENVETLQPGLYLDVQVDPAHGAAQESAATSRVVATLGPTEVAELRRRAAEILQRDPAHSSGPASRREGVFLQRAVELVQRPACARSPARAPHRRHAIAARALGRVDGRSDGASLSVRRLAEELCVSERTLYRSFSDELGIGPYDYAVVRRLNTMRRLLLEGPREPGAVTDAAGRAGFTHLGQMGALYRRFFGETPRETLRRGDLGAQDT